MAALTLLIDRSIVFARWCQCEPSSNTWSLGFTRVCPQTTSRSVQPFQYSSSVCPMHRHTNHRVSNVCSNNPHCMHAQIRPNNNDNNKEVLFCHTLPSLGLQKKSQIQTSNGHPNAWINKPKYLPQICREEWKATARRWTTHCGTQCRIVRDDRCRMD